MAERFCNVAGVKGRCRRLAGHSGNHRSLTGREWRIVPLAQVDGSMRLTPTPSGPAFSGARVLGGGQ